MTFSSHVCYITRRRSHSAAYYHAATTPRVHRRPGGLSMACTTRIVVVASASASGTVGQDPSRTGRTRQLSKSPAVTHTFRRSGFLCLLAVVAVLAV